MRKQHIILLDSETCQNGEVADVGAVIIDRSGTVINQFACLVRGVYDDRENFPLFTNEAAGDLWNTASLDRRYAVYDRMLESGSRMIASTSAINGWLMRAKAHYDPILTAYNLPFDVNHCQQTGIDLTPFTRRFCLWSAAVTVYAKTRKYRKFIVDNHLFKPVTKHGNMSYPTNAETMTRFVLGDIHLPDEPHTSLEDCIGYELPILAKILKAKSLKWLLSEPLAYNWRDFQVKDHFKPL
jgi:hypothetical protein